MNPYDTKKKVLINIIVVQDDIEYILLTQLHVGKINGTPILIVQFDASFSPFNFLPEHVTTHVIGT